MRVLGWAAMLAAAAVAQPVRATWYQAETAHFRVIGEGRADNISKRAVDLEQFDAVLRTLFRVNDDGAATANPLTVYVVADQSAVEAYCGCRNVAGFYKPRATDAIAFTPRSGGDGGKFALKPQQVLFHEYGHHFLLGNTAIAVPKWFGEGYAEFVATFYRDKDRFVLGAPPLYRAYALLISQGISWQDLVAGREPRTYEGTDGLYGRGWLLTHYLMLDDGRRKQLQDYLTDINQGVVPQTAAERRFGDVRQLSKALDRYLTAPKISVLSIPAATVATPTAAVRPLSEGESAMIRFRMRSTVGVNNKTAPPLFAQARPVAERYAGDAVVQGWAAEMALDAGDLAASATFAQRALAVDPGQRQALLYLAEARLRQLRKAGGDAKAWTDARHSIVTANRAAPNAAAPLVLYYRSFLMQGVTPPKIAVEGLLRAQDLVPQDPMVRFMAVRQLVRDGERTKAIQLLRPLAYDPHAPADNPAVKLLAQLEGGTAPAVDGHEAGDE